jgi:hydroxymethylpyrimidine kinase/phosphomethylpyrimidine kinase
MVSKLPCALAISGLDPGGGAGLAADLRAFHAAGVFGCSALALTTVQSTNRLRSVYPLSSARVVAMARCVLEDQNVRAVKTGALGTAANVRAVAKLLGDYPKLPVVIDPVMVASRGDARLASDAATLAFAQTLLPRASLITPNVPEAEALTGLRIRTVAQAQTAAARLCAMGADAALVKGGHLGGARAIDVLALRSGGAHIFSAKRLPIRTRVHGGGCTLSSLIAGRLATGEGLLDAVSWSKRKLQIALEKLVDVGGHLRVIVL